ncbi:MULTISPECIES: hypothetical protein [Photorhabdus]|uniref:hypothetical protein n=1 Tax=Photorhabdus TaxID=29487 RepID=UPI000699ECD6|nr:hypothetical protein [Photorhabdus thracensis]MCC8422339.1 hypothetical protein [Photorhabdus thracensis]
MTQHKEKFDGLAKGYDRYRPRYPQALFREICHWLPKDRALSVVDIGAGTGIALGGWQICLVSNTITLPLIFRRI